MGSWDYTTYVQTNDVARIVRVLEFLFELEGYSLVETDGAAWTETFADSIQYDRPERMHLAFAVLPGVRDWSIIKTAPFDILARPAPRHHTPRLAHVANWLRCNAIYVQLEDSVFFSAIEVDRRSRVSMSGVTMHECEHLDEFCGSPLHDEQPLPNSADTSENGGPFLLFPDINPHLSYPPGVDEVGRHLTERDDFISSTLILELLRGRPWPMDGAISRFFVRKS